MSKKFKQLIGRIVGITLLALFSLFLNSYISAPEKETMTVQNNSDTMEVHFINVGQGDSILVEAGGAAMLIDAGENNKGTAVVNYLKAQHIVKLDYLVGTHPHSDHVGGLDTVIRSLPINMVIMPEIVHTTETFEDVLNAIDEKGLKITKAEVGKHYTLGPATFTIIAPNASSYEELNNYSVGIKLTYGDNSFLFTGDAEKLSEEEMLQNGIDLSADVLKLAHHGSSYSSSEDFLDAVNPSYTVISVGEDNQYGHPHTETLQQIANRNIKLYRTDKQGTVVFTSDGRTISVNTDNYVITETDLQN